MTKTYMINAWCLRPFIATLDIKADTPRRVGLWPVAGRTAGGRFRLRSPLGPVSFGDVYMTSDFAVQSSVPRLSRLVLACILSNEVRDILEQKLTQKVRTIGTTAFTDKPVSMKYRGVFDLHFRNEGRLNYLGEAG